jgi:hypothetical protein
MARSTSFRGITFSYDDVIKAMELFDKELRSSFPEKHWVTYAVKYDDKLYPPKRLLRLVTGLDNVGSGGKPVNSRFEELGFTVVSLDGEPPTKGSEETDAETEIAFTLESDLENSLISNLEQLEAGLRLYKENGITGQQYDTKVVGRIDILAVDANGDFVVIELKAVEANRQVLGQIQAYMGWVKKNLASDRQVRGIIVANDFDVRAIYGARVVPNLSLKRYLVTFKFIDINDTPMH